MTLKINGGIGDELGASAILRDYKKLHPEVNLSVELSRAESLFIHNPYISHKEGPVVILYPTTVCWEHNIESYAKQLGISLSSNLPEIFLTEEEKFWADNKLQKLGTRIICIATHSSFPSNIYQYFNEVVDGLHDKGYKVIELGNHIYSDYPAVHGLLEKADLQFVNTTTIREAACLIHGTLGYIGLDTGLFHIAAALDKKQIVLYRSSGCKANSYNTTYPMVSIINCAPQCRVHCFESISCINKISSEEIVDLACSLF